MDTRETQVLENAAMLYTAIPEYLSGDKQKKEIAHLLVDLIDSLDDIEYARSGTPLYDIIGGDLPGRRKQSILALERKYELTKREAHILRYLANDRNPTYIANALRIATATAKTHKYAIFRKLGVHSTKEFKQLLATYGNDSAEDFPILSTKH